MRGHSSVVKVLVTSLLASSLLIGCQRKDETKKLAPVTATGSAAPTGAKAIEQVTPPLDLATPPADAVKTSSGLIYKKLTTNDAGVGAKRNDTVMINYTGWRQGTGETFYSNKARNQPMPLALANTAPGFTEAMQLIKTGERAMLWIPPQIGYKGTPPPGATPETLVYEVEVVDIVAAPPVPPDVATPPANASALPSGIKYLVVNPGTGTVKAKFFDTVTFNYSAWDAEGRMFDSTEMRKRPATVPPYRQTAAMEEILTSMTAGSRTRFWVPAERMQQGGKPIAGLPEGTLTYEVELLTITPGIAPPPTPSDVAAPPASAKKTPKGVAYRVLKAGAGGPKPVVPDVVKVHYTGWTTDGRMVDSSMIKNEPAQFALNGVIAGWVEGIPLMSIGDRMRFWIPEDLAYKGAPGKPQGMLVYDIELIEFKPPAAPAAADAPPALSAPATLTRPAEATKPTEHK